MPKPCECLFAGWCPVWKQRITGRQYEICRGVNCPTEMTERYQDLWARDARDTIVVDSHVKTCEDLPEELKEKCLKSPAFRAQLLSPRAGPWGLMRKAGVFVRSQVRFALDGFRTVKPEVAESRQAICASCPNWQNNRCKICGCSGIKFHYPLESCPDSPPRWGPVTREGRLAVAVTTAARAVPTLEKTLESLASAGFPAPTIFDDSEPVGAWLNWLAALRYLYSTGAEHLLVVQDDAVFVGNAEKYLRHVMKDDGPMSLIRSEKYEIKEYPWTRWTGRYFWLAQALLFPRDVAERFLASDLTKEWEQGHRAQIDVAVGEWCNREQVPLWLSCPSLADHTGRPQHGSDSSEWMHHSTGGYGMGANDFAGEKFDAMLLLGASL